MFTFEINAFSAFVRSAINITAVASVVLFAILWPTGYLNKFLKSIYGFESDEEVTKFSILGLCFGVIIGAYWLLRTLKDPVFYELVGRQYVPFAKFATPFLIAIVLFAIGYLSDKMKKHRLFLAVALFFGIVFAAVGIFWKMNLPELHHPLVDWIPGRALGWILYWAIELFGGAMVTGVFWAFAASTTKTVFAKRGFFLVTLGGQIGNLFGPAFNAGYATVLGNPNLVVISAVATLLIPLVMEYYMKVLPAHMHESDDSGHKSKKTGALEGLRLIATKPFLLGVAVVSVIYEVIATIVDLQFKYLISEVYIKEEMTAFVAFAAMASALLSIALSLGGTKMIVDKLGVRKSLFVYPLILGAIMFGLWSFPSLWPFFVGFLIMKSFAYAFNSPIKELLYLPTSKDVKMKAKGFIDGFGGKGAKGLGSVITGMLAGNLGMLLAVGGLISLVIIGFWLVVAMAVGTKYEELVEKKEIIE